MDINTVAWFTSPGPAIDIAASVVERLEADGYRCSRVTKLDNSATFTTKVRRLSILVVVYPDHEGTDQWVVTLGPGVLPSSRLIGMSDNEQRVTISSSIGAALDVTETIGAVQWYTDEAWAALQPRVPKPERRRWWARS